MDNKTACQEILTKRPFSLSKLALIGAFMKRIVLAIALVFALMFSLLSGAEAVQFDYGQFEGLPYTLPVVTVSSPSSSEPYNVPDVPLNVTVQIRSTIYAGNVERIRWLNYSLDGQASVPMTLNVPSDLSPPYNVQGKEVLAGLPDGNHNLTIYGETFVGGLNGYFNETVSFTVDTTPEPEPFPQSLIIASAIAIAVICTSLSLLIYFKNRKH
jgi:hypothetical protein